MRNRFLIPLLGGFLATSACATTVLIDFGSAPTVVASPTWNNFTGTASGSSISLLDTTGATTGAAITLSGGTITSIADNTTASVPTYAPFTPSTVVQDFVFETGTRTFTLSGLNPAVSYDLTFYTYADRNTTRGTSYAISGHTPLVLEPSGSPIALDSGGQVGTISGVVPNASGNIAIVVSSTASTNWILSGLAINYTIPEPSAALLTILGAGLFGFRRRRTAGIR